MRTANTPAFSSGRAVNEATSPAAKIFGSFSVCSRSLTWMKPCASSARPVLCSQAGPPAWVTHRVSSVSKRRPSCVCRQPGVTSVTSACACTATPRACSTRAKRARTPGLWVGKMVSPAVSNTNCSRSGLRPSACSSVRSRYCMDSTSSTPPAPPPTTVTVSGACSACTRASRPSQRWLNWAMGFTGTAWAWAPSTLRTLGVEPVLMDSRS